MVKNKKLYMHFISDLEKKTLFVNFKYVSHVESAWEKETELI